MDAFERAKNVKKELEAAQAMQRRETMTKRWVWPLFFVKMTFCMYYLHAYVRRLQKFLAVLKLAIDYFPTSISEVLVVPEENPFSREIPQSLQILFTCQMMKIHTMRTLRNSIKASRVKAWGIMPKLRKMSSYPNGSSNSQRTWRSVITFWVNWTFFPLL